METILAYHGGQQEEVHWLSTEHEHAASFASPSDEIVLYEVSFSENDVLRIDCESDPELYDRYYYSYDADDYVQRRMEEEHANVALLIGWESDGIDILVADDYSLERVSETEGWM